MGGLDPPYPWRPPRAGRAQPPPSSGARVSPDRLRRKGEVHVSQAAPPMGTRDARGARPRIGFPARA